MTQRCIPRIVSSAMSLCVILGAGFNTTIYAHSKSADFENTAHALAKAIGSLNHEPNISHSGFAASLMKNTLSVIFSVRKPITEDQVNAIVNSYVTNARSFLTSKSRQFLKPFKLVVKVYTGNLGRGVLFTGTKLPGTDIIDWHTGPSQRYKRYTNARFGFSFEYPSSWKESPRPTDGDGRYFITPSGDASFNNQYGFGVPKTDVLFQAVGFPNAVTGSGNGYGFNRMVASFVKSLSVERKQKGLVSEHYAVVPNKWILDSIIRRVGHGGIEYSEAYTSLSANITYSLTVPQSELDKYTGIWSHIKSTFVPNYVNTADGIHPITTQSTRRDRSFVLSRADMRVGKLHFEESFAQLQKQYGDPNVKTFAHGNGSPLWEYNKLGFEVIGNPVWEITVSSATLGSTPRGIHVGSTVQSAMKAYPSLKSSGNQLFYSSALYSIDLLIQKGKVSRIILSNNNP